jgi:hypothetical protein
LCIGCTTQRKAKINDFPDLIDLLMRKRETLMVVVVVVWQVWVWGRSGGCGGDGVVGLGLGFEA